jgi:hypothetical protein
MDPRKETKRHESRIEVQSFIGNLKYAIESGSAKIDLIEKRQVDIDRKPKFTNSYTLSKLFPQEDYVEAMKKELVLLKVEDYIETVKDLRFPKKSEMRVFGKVFTGEDVYIKIRVELLSLAHAYGENYIMVMSFHYSDRKFNKEDFLYRKTGDC